MGYVIKEHKKVFPKFLIKNVVYKLSCNDCNLSYVGQTGRQLQTQIIERKNHINRNMMIRSVIITENRMNYNHNFN